MNPQLSSFIRHLKQDDSTFSASEAFYMVGALYLAYLAAVIFYRLTFHPLAKFPGPFLCKISFIQQCYYEAILNGKFLGRLTEYHRKYGKFCYVLLTKHEILD